MSRKKIIGVTLGDPGGIGPEIVLKILPQYLTLQKKGVFFLILGHMNVLKKNKKYLKCNFPFKLHTEFNLKNFNPKCINVLPPSKEKPFKIGRVDRQNGILAFDAIRLGTDLALQGKIQGLMTAPVNKESVQKTVKNFHGHTDYLAERAKLKNHAMLLVGGPLRVVLVTAHIPLKDVSKTLSTKLIVDKTVLTNETLKKELGRKPRIGISGLNPHGGDGGLIGKEEKQIIFPAVKRLKQKNLNVIGPIPGDTVFALAYQGKIDVVISMYHDLGLAPLKMVAFDEGINVTLGLPFKRSTPDHGTAFDIAYKGIANPGSIEKAFNYLI